MSEFPDQKRSSPDLPFDQLFNGEIPNLVAMSRTITPEEVDLQIDYLQKHGVVIEDWRGWVNAGFRHQDGRFVMNLPNASPSDKLHEAVHIQHMLGAKRQGVSTYNIEWPPIYQKCLDEIIASSASLSLLERTNLTNSHSAKLERLNIELNKLQMKEESGMDLDEIFPNINPLDLNINPYLWNL